MLGGVGKGEVVERFKGYVWVEGSRRGWRDWGGEGTGIVYEEEGR